jgi:hypothetical protein
LTVDDRGELLHLQLERQGFKGISDEARARSQHLEETVRKELVGRVIIIIIVHHHHHHRSSSSSSSS